VRPIRYACLFALLFVAGQRPAIAADDTVTIYRCLDAKGHVTLQDDPCPKDSKETSRSMARPKDAPVRSAKATAPPSYELPEPPANEPYPDFAPPPPPMYQCTSYDGIVRESEVYDPNPHCEPLVLYYPNPEQLTPQQATSCRWVQDSCVRLSDEQTCALFRQKKREAESALLHAFSDTQSYRKSELQRLTQIVDESCR
jgi:hypothetical protein